VNPLDQRQRQITLAAAGLAAVLVLAIWIPQLGAHVRKGQVTPSLALISGLILAGLLGTSLLINKRYIVGLAALFLAFLGPWGNYALLAVPYAGLAGWLVITAGREAGRRRPGSERRPAAPRRRRPEAGAASRPGARTRQLGRGPEGAAFCAGANATRPRRHASHHQHRGVTRRPRAEVGDAPVTKATPRASKVTSTEAGPEAGSSRTPAQEVGRGRTRPGRPAHRGGSRADAREVP